MFEDIRKFEELAKTDEEFQQKLKARLEAYTGEPNEESVFNNVLVPLGEEYGISATFEEFKQYIEGLKNAKDEKISFDELEQVAGGKGREDGSTAGGGVVACSGVGLGLGFGSSNHHLAYCTLLGFGSLKGATACFDNGAGSSK